MSLLALMASAGLAAGEENLYLIASEPFDAPLATFPTLFYRLDGGQLTKIRTVTTQRQDTMFARVYHDKGYAVVASDGAAKGSFLLNVIDLESVSAQTSYDIDTCEGCFYIESYLLSRNDSLIYVILGRDRDRVYRGVNLRTGAMSSDFDDRDEVHAYSGSHGNGFVDHGGGIILRNIMGVGKDAVIYEWGNARRLGWTLPDGLELRKDGSYAVQYMNNDHLRVTSIGGHPRDSRSRLFYVYAKAGDAWSKLKLSGGLFSLRAYRHWLIAEEIYRGIPGSPELERLEVQHFPPFLSAADRLRARDIAPSGRFYLYNARTQALIIHDTGEPNSEVLYVDEDDAVYYRVSDELRRAQIEDGELARPSVLVKSPVLWAVHWLFLGKE